MKHEIPEFLHRALIDQYGGQIAARIMQGYACKRAVSARVNTLKTTPADLRAALAGAGIESRPVAWSDQALILSDTDERAVAPTEAYESGALYLQSLSSMLPVTVLGARAGENILDMAAAPGGKTTQIAALTENRALITACEKNPVRAERLKYNIRKLGARGINVMVQDAGRLDPLFVFDRILLDAPCSGSGTIDLGGGRPPAITPELVERSERTQRALLRAAVSHLRPGGEMVYSTCSVLAGENEEAVRTLTDRGKAELVPLDLSRFEGVPLLPTSLPGTVCVCPDGQYEGFFIAKLRKK